MNFKDEKSSIVPDGWTLADLESLGAFSKGSGIKKDELQATGLPCVRYGEIYTTHEHIVKECSSFISDTVAKDSKQIKAGDILFAGSGESREEIGKAVAYLHDNVAYAGGDVVILSTGNIELAAFLTYALETDLARWQKYRVGEGYSVVHIYKEDLCNLKILLAPPAEQRAIAYVLGLVDRAIELNNKIIAQKELRKKWLMQNLLTGQKRLKGFTGEWKEVQIGELLEPIYRYVEWNDDHVYKLVSIRRRYRGITERGNFHGHQIEVKKVKTIKENDFLISKRQVSHGAWALVSKDFHGFSVSDEYDCLTLRDVQKLDMGFWGWFCQNPQMSHYAYLASNGVHIEKLIFDYDTFKKRRVTIPVELAEQQQIASALTSADTELFLLARKTDQLREKKKWLMQQLLTGKRRIQILDE